MANMKLIIFTDGASRGNPGHASYGFTISDAEGNLIHEGGQYIGIETNNVAEYSAVLAAFSLVKEQYGQYSPLEINLFADSKLVAEQLGGKWQIKNENLKNLFYQIKILEKELGKVSYTHVYREKNTAADRQANLALDAYLK
jgi:ribonuclease HI